MADIKDNKDINLSTTLSNFSLKPIKEKEDKKYSMIRQDSAINALVRISSKSKIDKTDFTDTGIIKTSNGSTDLKAIIEEYGKVTIRQSTSKMLRILTMVFTKTGNKFIKIPLKEYMELTGLKNEKEARKNIKADLETLHNITCEARKHNRTNKSDYIRFETIAERGIQNSIIFANLTDSVYAHLMTCPLMPYPKSLLSIDNKNPYAFYLGDKIAELMKYNQYNKTTRKVRPYFIVSVKTLLDICMKNGMPSYEDIKAGSRQIDKRIITPFERDLEACSINIFDWEYCNEKGVPLREEQTAYTTPKGKYKALSYEEFIDLYLKITPNSNYPRGEYIKKSHKKKNK